MTLAQSWWRRAMLLGVVIIVAAIAGGLTAPHQLSGAFSAIAGVALVAYATIFSRDIGGVGSEMTRRRGKRSESEARRIRMWAGIVGTIGGVFAIAAGLLILIGQIPVK